MSRINLSARQTGVFSIIAGLSLTLGACSADNSSQASPKSSRAVTELVESPASGSPSSSAPDSAAPIVAASGDFCSLAADATAASHGSSQSMDGINAALSDPGGVDMTSIHDLSQQLLDSANVAAGFYASGAATADDPDAKEAFAGLSDVISAYSVPLAQAGLQATSMSAFSESVTALGDDPTTRDLLAEVVDWGYAASDYTEQQCGFGFGS